MTKQCNSNFNCWHVAEVFFCSACKYWGNKTIRYRRLTYLILFQMPDSWWHLSLQLVAYKPRTAVFRQAAYYPGWQNSSVQTFGPLPPYHEKWWNFPFSSRHFLASFKTLHLNFPLPSVPCLCAHLSSLHYFQLLLCSLAKSEGNRGRFGVEKENIQKKEWEVQEGKICLIHSEEHIGGGIKEGRGSAYNANLRANGKKVESVMTKTRIKNVPHTSCTLVPFLDVRLLFHKEFALEWTLIVLLLLLCQIKYIFISNNITF